MRTSVLAIAMLVSQAAAISSQQALVTPETDSNLALATDAVAPARFVAAHGERALLMGYSGSGLEAWAYPFQIVRDYHVSFLPQGDTAAVNGDAILRRIEYLPEEIVRTYVGPDFLVREHLFVPVNQPGAILTYDVEGRRAVDVKVSFLPTLNLMWPGGLGGQDLRWSDALSGYVISELTTGARAVVASPEQAAHSEVVNSTLRRSLAQSMVLRPVHGHARVFIGLEDRSDAEGAEVHRLEQQNDALYAAARAHVQAALANGIQIETPDQTLNRTIAWSRLALDQAWVCNARLGCGIVAGYGPSRGMRRPQYAWFFAGDGLVAVHALLATGNLERARAELAFILKYQSPGSASAPNGMIWHELSQSAGYIDWKKYPYMYVHVDITFQFLATLGDYYEATNDRGFLEAHWPAIAAAYNYCRSVVNPATGLPAIPANKEGGNEQDRMSEDAGLSAAWVTAAEAFQHLAQAMGHSDDAAQAGAAASVARKALAARYWDVKKQFWIAGYNVNGQPMTDERSHADLLHNHLFAPEQEDAALTRLASAAFQTDWGTRGMSANSVRYNPDSYAAGSVSALQTASMAGAFWAEHRPAIAWPMWNALLPWLQLDSLGHMHEVLAGDFYHPQVESVPEQTWSSAGLLISAMHGIFGIAVDAPDRTLTLAPHLDPRWAAVSIKNIDVDGTRVSATMEQKTGETDIALTETRNLSRVDFGPEIPLGATKVSAVVDGRRVAVQVERNGEDEHARVELPAGARRCAIRYVGGVSLLASANDPEIGASSRGLKLTQVHLQGRILRLEADVRDAEHASVEIETPWRILSVEGGTATSLGGGWYRVGFAGVPASSGYVRRALSVTFADH